MLQCLYEGRCVRRLQLHFKLQGRCLALSYLSPQTRHCPCARVCVCALTQRPIHHSRSISDPNLHPPQSAFQTRLGDF